MHAALASPIRRRLLVLLRAGDTARDAHDLAQAMGLHLTTVRFHLEVLLRAGFLVHSPVPRGVGRPRIAYLPVSRRNADPAANYQELAALLAAHLSDTAGQRAARAEQAGLAWAEQLVPSATSANRAVDEAAQHMSALFAELGFDPELTAMGPDGRQIALHACPFRAVARQHPEVVCSAHLGLLRGGLARLGAPVASRLLPFVKPELCVAQLAPLE